MAHVRRLTREEREGVGSVLLARESAKSLEYLVDHFDLPLIERNIRAVASVAGFLLCRTSAAASGGTLELGSVKDRPMAKYGILLLTAPGPVSWRQRRLAKRVLPGIVRTWPDAAGVLPGDLGPETLAEVMPLLLTSVIVCADGLITFGLWSESKLLDEWTSATGQYEDLSGKW
jgi:hypothetical protein